MSAAEKGRCWNPASRTWTTEQVGILQAMWAAARDHKAPFFRAVAAELGRPVKGVRRKARDIGLGGERSRMMVSGPAVVRLEREPLSVVPSRCPRCGNVLVSLSDPDGGRRVACLHGCYDAWL